MLCWLLQKWLISKGGGGSFVKGGCVCVFFSFFLFLADGIPLLIAVGSLALKCQTHPSPAFNSVRPTLAARSVLDTLQLLKIDAGSSCFR